MVFKSVLKYILLLALSVVLSMTTVVLGALPMRVIRRVYGRLPFWGGHLIAAAALTASGPAAYGPAYGLLVLTLAVAVGVYTEIEEHGGSVFTSGATGILAAFGTTLLGVGAWFYKFNGRLLEEARAQVTPLVERLTEMNANASVSVESLIQQIPSAIMIGIMIALAVALAGGDRVMSWIGYRKQAARTDEVGLADFRVPDFLTWLVILSIFGAFYQHGNHFAEVVALNVLNVLTLVYFFQGLAVVNHIMRAYKVGPIWQGLWYVILIFQLFIVVSFLGLADYWLEFRERLARKAAETNKNFLK